MAIALLVLIIAGGGAYVFREQLALAAFDLFLSGSVEKQLEKSYAPLESEAPTSIPVKIEKSAPFTALLLGVDQRDNEPARSDTIIYSVVRPEDSRVLLVSIPRDTYVNIIGKDKKDKINHAYAFGGEKMAKDTVQHFLGYPAEYYAAINFNGLKEVVDALGGVELPITKDIVNKQADHEKFTIKANQPIYGGVDALNYVRYREDSDFERTKRHQIFLNAFVNRVLNLNQVTKIPQLIDIMGKNFKTDMPPSMIIDLSKQLLTGEHPQMSSFTIMGEGRRIDNIFYDMVNEDDLAFAKQMIENWTNPDTSADELLLPEARPQD
ncbi:transcriptional regulator [Paenibacillus yonginensis]|uniref:Transcriptional regulator n=1 Tax=Paenibacillus yonginensis TaxID=1462996 RepID=A0A1B1N7C3_9BACL|nr:LCP family protein [Paenibacillus yonginensis]ANS77339.1 transcriptional regulator [Paenibacillus yonginensis]